MFHDLEKCVMTSKIDMFCDLEKMCNDLKNCHNLKKMFCDLEKCVTTWKSVSQPKKMFCDLETCDDMKKCVMT